MSDEAFDPYWQWLQIPPHERPVDHYRLLGLALFESDGKRIEQAADQRMSLVRSFQAGPRVAHTQKLLNELSVARLCLLNVTSKAAYDAMLRGRLALGAPAPGSPTFPVAAPVAAPVAVVNPPAAPHAAPVARPYQGPPAAPPIAAHPPIAPSTSPTTSSAPTSSSDEHWESSRPLGTRPWFWLFVAVLVAGLGVAGWMGIKSRGSAPMTTEATDLMQAAEAPANDVPSSGSSNAEGGRKSSADPSRTTQPEDDLDARVVIVQEGTGEVHLAAQTAQLLGEQLTLTEAGVDQVVAGWGTPDETLAWNFKVFRPDIFRVELTYAASDAARGARFAFRVDEDDIKTGQIESSGGSDKFRTDIFLIPVRKNGAHEFSLTVLDLPKNPAAEVKFKSIRLIPKGLGDKK